MSAPIALVGYGKMGRLLEQLAPQYGFHVSARFDSGSAALSHETLNGARVALEFTVPEVAAGNLRRLAKLGVNTICGTTGWRTELEGVRAAIESAGTALVWGANFSVGTSLFFSVVAHAAQLVARHSDYEAWGWEIHHSEKKDATSGTLGKLADEIRANGYAGTLTLAANRAGAHPGTHEIGFDSPADTITLRHTARNREGFARGALQAARWIQGQRGVFEFSEILGELC